MRRLGRLALRLYGLAAPYAYLWFALALTIGTATALPAQGASCCGAGTALAELVAPAGPATGATGGRAVVRVGLTVSDAERSIAFYRDVLSFSVVADTEVAGPEWERLTGLFGVRLRRVTLRLGREELELTEYLAASNPGRPAPVDSRSNDRWFQHVAIIVSDMDSAYRVLRAHRVRHVSTGPQLLPKSIPGAAGIRAFYFRDPDAHPLEILQFPPDKGDPRWQRRDRLFLGIDHTAIVVGSTARSLGFYRDLLGLRVAGSSENQGDEQARLNNVEGAHLRITGLRAPAGPGIEFLEYIAPLDGRPYPADERADDLIHWETTIAVEDLDGLLPRLATAGAPVVSRPDSGRNRAADLGVLLRDPDGHVLHLVRP